MTKTQAAPHSKDSEMMVLGSMLNSVNSLNAGADALDDGDFYFKENKIVFGALKAAYKNGKPADLHLISEELKRRDELSAIGGLVYLVELCQFAGTSAHIEHYASLVSGKAILRKAINAADTIRSAAISEPEDVVAFVDEAQGLLFNLTKGLGGDPGVPIESLLSGVKSKSQISFMDELSSRKMNYDRYGPEEAGITGIPTGFVDLDDMVNGLNNSNLMILGARPSMGKTALAINIAENVAFNSKIPVGIFSLEMSSDQLVQRIISSQSGIDSNRIKIGSLSQDEFNDIHETVGRIWDSPMIIDDQPALTLSDLKSRARRMKETHNVGLIVIDYIQLITTSGKRNIESRQLEISEISRSLKNLARELDIPILCLSQLSRKVEERQGHRPIMSDLRESGSIEQDADVVMFLLRQEYYNPNDKVGKAELIIGKNRHGSVGNITLNFKKDTVKFSNYSYCDIDDQSSKNTIKNINFYDKDN